MFPERFLQQHDLDSWLTALSRERRVLVPMRENGTLVFRPLTDGVSPVLSQDATTSPKAVVFPSCRELFRFEQTKNPEDPEQLTMQLKSSIDAEKTILFGARPCGARGFTVFDRVYRGDRFPDPYYQAAREQTLVVTLTCERPESTCFCHWVGGGPDDPTGSDVLATVVEGGYFLEAVTERGALLLEHPLLSENPSKAREAAANRAEVRQHLDKAIELSGISSGFLELFDDYGFWEEVSAKCLSCGACTYLCPTCYCFTITDEAGGLTGKRLRSWDTCMSFQFTLEASGHNPRPTKAHRLRNRVGHKFSYYPALHGGLFACCGCGRCIKYCPASVDLREIVCKVAERAGNRGEVPHDQYAQ
jgi:ferredoxin